MMSSLDLVLLPLARIGGKERSKLPGVHVAAPPRRAARGRRGDRLFVYLSLEGNAPLSPTEMDRLTAHLAAEYYKTSGSSTAAMRAVAEGLNELLLQRNLNAVSRGRQAVGVLVLGVVRERRLYLLQSGAAHAYLVNVEGARQFYEPGAAGRGLGVSRAAKLQFYQATLSPGDVLLMSPDPPLAWNTTTLRNLHGLSLRELHQRLLRRSTGEMEALLLQVGAGRGRIRLVAPQLASDTRPRGAARPETSPNPSPKHEPAPRPASAGDASATPIADLNGVAVSPLKPPAADNAPPLSPTPKAAARAPRLAWMTGLVPTLKEMGRSVGKSLQQVAQAGSVLFQRMLPDDSALTLPGSTMAFIAVAVPLVVVAVSAVVYFQRGQGALYDDYFLRAQQAASQAQQFEHAGEQRIGWQATLGYLDLAETYRVTEESQALRVVAAQALDQLDKVVRVEYQRALPAGQLPASAQITRMVTTVENDLYMLDSAAGQVYRAVFTGKGYELDDAFFCGKVQTPLIVSALVDIAPLPPGHPAGATVAGLDGDGNLVECIPAREDQLIIPLPPPASNWGTPRALAFDAGDLYVLDTLTNSVWVYDGAGNYQELPAFFFNEDVPDMKGAIDMAVNGRTLYLLSDDSSMAMARFQKDPVEQPVIYQDTRPDFPDGPTMVGATFRQVLFSPPPDPSIYLLDGSARAIYHLSLQLVYQRQYRPSGSLPEGEATAFTVGQDRRVFLALGNQVYFGFLP